MAHKPSGMHSKKYLFWNGLAIVSSMVVIHGHVFTKNKAVMFFITVITVIAHYTVYSLSIVANFLRCGVFF